MKSKKYETLKIEFPFRVAATPKAPRNRSRIHVGLAILIAILLLSFVTGPLALAGSPSQFPTKETILQEARALIDKDETNQKSLLEAVSLLKTYGSTFPEEIRFPLYLAEAYYRLADPNGDIDKEFHYYEKTGEYAQRVLDNDPNRAEGHYWHGLFLLKKAQKRGVGVSAYLTVKEGIKELEKVRESMPAYDHAGASRVLGLLYCLAPGWTPFGNLDKSIELGKEAARLAPDYALNRLYLANAYKKRGDKEDAIREYQAVLAAAAKMPGEQAESFGQIARNMLLSLGHQ